MADTVGSLVDKLVTVDMKMWNNQEILYQIRRMTFEEYKEKYFSNEDGALELWESLKKSCDLNFQRNQLIDELDEKIVSMIDSKMNGSDIKQSSFIQKKYKTY